MQVWELSMVPVTAHFGLTTTIACTVSQTSEARQVEAIVEVLTIIGEVVDSSDAFSTRPWEDR